MNAAPISNSRINSPQTAGSPTVKTAFGTAAGAFVGGLVGLLNFPTTWVLAGFCGVVAVHAGVDVNELPTIMNYASGFMNDGEGSSAGYWTGVGTSIAGHATAGGLIGLIDGATGGGVQRFAEKMKAKRNGSVVVKVSLKA